MTNEPISANDTLKGQAAASASEADALKSQADEQFQVLEKKHKDGANWFFWIAGLSVVNSVVLLMGSDRSFVIGLGLTQLIDGVAMAIAQGTEQSVAVLGVMAFVLDAIVAGSFIVWGVLARRYHRWAYLVGMVLYALDGVIFILVKDYMSIGFHILALFFLFNGFRASGQAQQLKRLASQVAAAGTPAP